MSASLRVVDNLHAKAHSFDRGFGA